MLQSTPMKTLSVSAIKNGTVVDHIISGRSFKIIELLRLVNPQKQVTIGLHLPSNSMGFKDIIKIQDRVLTDQEANQVAIFSPQASISIIQEYEIVKKFKVCIPDVLEHTPLCCPNPKCITNYEPQGTIFTTIKQMNNVMIKCTYCEKIFSQQEFKTVS